MLSVVWLVARRQIVIGQVLGSQSPECQLPSIAVFTACKTARDGIPAIALGTVRILHPLDFCPIHSSTPPSVLGLVRSLGPFYILMLGSISSPGQVAAPQRTDFVQRIKGILTKGVGPNAIAPLLSDPPAANDIDDVISYPGFDQSVIEQFALGL